MCQSPLSKATIKAASDILYFSTCSRQTFNHSVELEFKRRWLFNVRKSTATETISICQKSLQTYHIAWKMIFCSGIMYKFRMYLSETAFKKHLWNPFQLWLLNLKLNLPTQTEHLLSIKKNWQKKSIFQIKVSFTQIHSPMCFLFCSQSIQKCLNQPPLSEKDLTNYNQQMLTGLTPSHLKYVSDMKGHFLQ